MRNCVREVVVIVALLATVFTSTAGASSAYVVNSLYKVRPSPASVEPWAIIALNGGVAKLDCARNDFELLQVVVDASSELEDVEVVLSPRPGEQFDPQGVRIFRGMPVDFAQASNEEGEALGCGDGGVCSFYDRLVPHKGLNPVFDVKSDGSGEWIHGAHVFSSRDRLPPGSRAVYFVEIFVSQSVRSATYVFDLDVVHSGVALMSAEVRLAVHDVDLPLDSSLPSVILLNPSPLCREFGLNDEKGHCALGTWSRQVSLGYSRLLLDHRLTSALADYRNATFPSGGMSWETARNEYLIDYESHLKGAALGHLRLEVVGADAGVAARPTTINLPWWHNLETDPPDPQRGLALPTPRNQAGYDAWAQVKAGLEHSLSALWLDYHPDIDEPEPNEIKGKPHWKHLRAHDAANSTSDAGLEIVLTANRAQVSNSLFAQDAGINESQFRIYAPVLNHVDDRHGGGDQTSGYHAFVSAGGRLWGYQSCMSHSCGPSSYTALTPAQLEDFAGWPSLMVDAAGVQNRAQPWLHYLYGLSGMLYYEAALASDKAASVNGLFKEDGNGDGTLVYGMSQMEMRNGAAALLRIPLASHRLKLLREGMEDYELLRQCADATNEAQARSIVQQVFIPLASGSRSGAMYSASSFSPNPGAHPTEQAFVDTIQQARKALLTCAGAGTLVENPNWSDGPAVSAPVIMGPIKLCSESAAGDLMVEVAGVVPGNVVRLYRGPYPRAADLLAVKTASGNTVRFIVPSGTHGVTPSLGAVSATQMDPNGNGSRAGFGAVGYHAAQVPTPIVDLKPPYRCSVATVVDNLSASAFYKVSHGEDAAMQTLSGPNPLFSSGYAVATFFSKPLGVSGQSTMSVEQKFCGMQEASSVPIEDWTGSMPIPKLESCNGQSYDGSHCIRFLDLVRGARVKLYDSKDAVLADVVSTSPLDLSIYVHVANPPVRAVQSLCSSSDPSEPLTDLGTPLQCSEMPAPTFKRPAIGDTSIHMRSWVPGARFHVFAGPNSDEEIGDSTWRQISLTRPIRFDDKVVVFQKVGGCKGYRGWEMTPIGGEVAH